MAYMTIPPAALRPAHEAAPPWTQRDPKPKATAVNGGALKRAQEHEDPTFGTLVLTYL